MSIDNIWYFWIMGCFLHIVDKFHRNLLEPSPSEPGCCQVTFCSFTAFLNLWLFWSCHLQYLIASGLVHPSQALPIGKSSPWSLCPLGSPTALDPISMFMLIKLSQPHSPTFIFSSFIISCCFPLHPFTFSNEVQGLHWTWLWLECVSYNAFNLPQPASAEVSLTTSDSGGSLGKRHPHRPFSAFKQSPCRGRKDVA